MAQPPSRQTEDPKKMVIYQYKRKRVFAEPPASYEECRNAVTDQPIFGLDKDDSDLEFSIQTNTVRGGTGRVFLGRTGDTWGSIIPRLEDHSIIYVTHIGGMWKRWLAALRRKPKPKQDGKGETKKKEEISESNTKEPEGSESPEKDGAEKQRPGRESVAVSTTSTQPSMPMPMPMPSD